MDPLTALTLISIFTLVALVVTDYRDYHEDDEAWLNGDSGGPPIHIHRGPRDAA